MAVDRDTICSRPDSWEPSFLYQNLNVRSTYSASAPIVTTESSGSQGVISSGPQCGSGFTWWYINWDNGYSGWSVQDYLLVVPAPTITGVTPNPITADPANGYQTLTINGANFVNKPTVAVTWTGGGTTVSSSQVTYVSSTQLTMSIKLGAAADNWTVKTTNPNGQASNTVGFTVQVQAPAPTITGVTPNPITADPANGYQTLTINGANFVNKPTVAVTWTGGGTTVSSSQVTYVSSTQLTMSIKLGAAADNWTVKTTNPNGQASNTVGFTVQVRGSRANDHRRHPESDYRRSGRRLPDADDQWRQFRQQADGTAHVDGSGFSTLSSSQVTYVSGHTTDHLHQAGSVSRQLDGEGHQPRWPVIGGRGLHGSTPAPAPSITSVTRIRLPQTRPTATRR